MNTALMPLTAQPNMPNLDETDYNQQLTAFYQAAILSALPVVLWRGPYDDDRQGLVDCSGLVTTTKVDFRSKTPGFVFSPFVNEKGQSTLFLQASLSLSQQDGLQVAANEANTDIVQNQAAFLQEFESLVVGGEFDPQDWQRVPRKGNRPFLSSESEFCQLVEEAVHYIESTDIKKVVASRATEHPLPATLNPVAIFEQLCVQYAHAFVSLISIPGLGTWIGATPETLLTLDSEQLYTMALAGTQTAPVDQPLGTVVWGQKEIEEQALVSDYIRDFFDGVGLTTYDEVAPRTVSAGNIVHLRSDFNVDARKAPANFVADQQQFLHYLGNQMLDSLHPTSAVCGMPKREALTFILDREQYDREYYSGFLGPIHIKQKSQLFVNLRCMQLAKESAILYVGVGITKDSVPALEWCETVWKSKTLLSVLEMTDALSEEPEPVI